METFLITVLAYSVGHLATVITLNVIDERRKDARVSGMMKAVVEFKRRAGIEDWAQR